MMDEDKLEGDAISANKILLIVIGLFLVFVGTITTVAIWSLNS